MKVWNAVIIDISGGTIQLLASDDGVNAAGGNDFEMTEDGLVLKSTDETASSDLLSRLHRTHRPLRKTQLLKAPHKLHRKKPSTEVGV